MPKQRNELSAADKELHDYALTFPGAVVEHPWGENAFKVKGKVFVFLSHGPNGDGLSITVKLPETGTWALTRPYVKPSGYGLGKHGWVTALFAPSDQVPVEDLKLWIEESYRAIAPKKLLAQLDGGDGKP
jgi:predicted DNA-binding protein (MmcQ/YjbR family)